MKSIGFWNNGRDEYPDYPHPKDLIKEGFWDEREKERVRHYLDYGSKCNSYRGSSTCRICGKTLGYFERTDGVYVWPDQLSHYIDHDVILPEEFIEHMRENGFISEIITNHDDSEWTRYYLVGEKNEKP